MLSVHPLKDDEVPEVEALWQAAADEMGRAWLPPQPPEERYTGSTSRYMVLVLQGQLVGGGGLIPLKVPERHTCALEAIYILPGWRGQELGDTLLASLLHKARKLGYQHCYLAAEARQRGLISLCLKAGFRRRTDPAGSNMSRGDTWLWLDL